MQIFAGTVLTGLVATAVFDIWSQLLSRMLGLPVPAWAVPGRWFASCARGRFIRPDIAGAPPVAGETAIGWIGHYLVGIAWAALVVLFAGAGWLKAPTLAVPLAVGIVTVGAGWFVMHPCMGLGITGSRRPHPWLTRGLQLLAHLIFGIGLWLGGLTSAALI